MKKSGENERNAKKDADLVKNEGFFTYYVSIGFVIVCDLPYAYVIRFNEDAEASVRG